MAIDSLADQARTAAHTIDRCLALATSCPDRGAGGVFASGQYGPRGPVHRDAGTHARRGGRDLPVCVQRARGPRRVLAEEHLPTVPSGRRPASQRSNPRPARTRTRTSTTGPVAHSDCACPAADHHSKPPNSDDIGVGSGRAASREGDDSRAAGRLRLPTGSEGAGARPNPSRAEWHSELGVLRGLRGSGARGHGQLTGDRPAGAGERGFWPPGQPSKLAKRSCLPCRHPPGLRSQRSSVATFAGFPTIVIRCYERAQAKLERVRHELGLNVRAVEPPAVEPRLPAEYARLFGTELTSTLEQALAAARVEVRRVTDQQLRRSASTDRVLADLDRQARAPSGTA